MIQLIKALKIIVNHIRPDGEFYPFSEKEQKELNELIKDVTENIHREKEDIAEWKIENNGGTTMWYECSKCGEAGDIWDKFCKHCGRKMTNAVAE